MANIAAERRQYSESRLNELKRRISGCAETRPFEPKLTMFAAGSYGRLEASEYSDLDLFFLYHGMPRDLEDAHIFRLRLFAKLIEIADVMGFPEFSNDGEFLEILFTGDMLEHLGGREDDYRNHFTTRILLLLEARPIYAETRFTQIKEEIVESYFRDYPDHPESFRPIFLVNDIIRYWKTLCLNYEHKRNQPAGDEDTRVKQKVKNFKLKFSRMMTCFATVAALSCQNEPVEPSEVVRLTTITPRERLENISEKIPELRAEVNTILSDYEWFLGLTGLTAENLRRHFHDKSKRAEAFARANSFGDKIYDLLKKADERHGYLRYLVI